MLGGNTYGTAIAIAPNDGTVFVPVFHGLYVGSTGNVTVGLVGGATVTFLNVPSGGFLPVQVNRVYATGTTATGIVGLGG